MTKRILSLLLLLSLLSACAPAFAGPEPEMISHTYIPTHAAILNPERGFFTPYELPGNAGFSPVRVTGNTLVHLNIRLDDWRETNIPKEVLDGLDQNFADLHAAGIKAILRVAYNQGPYPDSEPDASKAQILRHIEQLKPLFHKHNHIIAWVEAGFIGAWGEWHTSTHGLDNLHDKKEILVALLAALPENRMVQVRYPANIIEMYPNPADAVKARVAHHNDCFLSSDTDVGTYERDGKNTILRDQAYLTELTRFTPMSGESCAPNPPRSECPSALQELALLHFSALNEAYHKGILRSWEQGGCLVEIENRLGYRLSLTSADFNEQVRPGGLLNIQVHLTNSGFAAPMNPRPLFIVLQEPNSIFLTQLELDPRQWQPGDSSFTLQIRMPAKIGTGRYNLALWLPDESANLQNNPLYAIRFANENTWDEKTGYNVLGQVTVDPAAGGGHEEGDMLRVVKLTDSPAIPQSIASSLPTGAPTPTAAIEESAASQTEAFISGLQASNNANTLTIQFSFRGATENYNGFQVFLDTDQNPATGFSIGSIGAEFLLENDALNAYTGTGSDWNWTSLDQAEIAYQNTAQTAQWDLQISDLGAPKALDFAAQLVDSSWNTVFITPEMSHILH